MRLTLLLLTGLVLCGRSIEAQLPLPTPPAPTGDPADTVVADPFRIRPPISPLGAMGRSLLLPGWGQSVLGRRVTGAWFVLFEGISLTMTLKSVHQLDYLKSVEREDDMESVERVDSKRQEIQDWAVLLAFNHLIAGAEAFVAALLWDFPDELVRAYEGPGVGVQVTLPLP